MTHSEPTFVDMFVASPARTVVLSVVPVLVAVLLGANVFVHGLPTQYAAGFVFVILACSAAVTRQHLAAFRTHSLEDRWLE